MIKERYSKVRESETNIYSDINSVYKNVGKKDLIETIKVKDKNGEISNPYIGYKNGVKRKELLLGLEPATNEGVFASPDLDQGQALSFYLSWRKKDYNLFDEVDPRVGLFPDKVEIKPSVKINSGETIDFLEKFNGGKDKFKEYDILRYALSSNQKGGTTINTSSIAQSATVREYTAFKTFKDVGNLITSMNFKIPFAFGQFGIFDAWEEVVKPVCALMSLYSPHKSKQGGGVSLYNTPYPTQAYLTAQQFKSIWGTPFETMATQFFNKNDGEKQKAENQQKTQNGNTKKPQFDFLNKSFQIAEQIAISGLLQVLKKTGPASHQFKYTTFRCGNFKIGPCIVKSIGTNFDYKQLDENGYPYKCELDITAMGMTTATNDTIIDAFLR